MEKIKLVDMSVVEPIDISKRSYIVITDNDEPRPRNYNNEQYIKWLNYKYIEKYEQSMPYHYIITSDGTLFSPKEDFVRTRIDTFDGHNDDIIVYIEGKLRKLSLPQEDRLVKLCSLVCQKYMTGPENILYFPYDNVGDDSIIDQKNFLKLSTWEVLKERDPSNIVKNSFLREENENSNVQRKAGFLSLKSSLTPKELSNVVGVPEEILIEQNQHLVESPAGTDSMRLDATGLNMFLVGQSVVTSYTMKGFGSEAANQKQSKPTFLNSFYSNINNLFDLSFWNAPKKEPKNTSMDTGELNISSSPNKRVKYSDSHRPYNESVMYQAELPGYENGYLEFINVNTGEAKIIGFMISPNGVSHALSNTQQISKTMAGWYIMRTGKNMQNINVTGYMLDTKHCQERHDFVEKYYKTYIEDKKNANNEYINEWSVNLIIEGKKYIGFVQAMSIQKASIQPFLYQYSINFVSIDDILIHRSSEAIQGANQPTTSPGTAPPTDAETSTVVGEAVNDLLTAPPAKPVEEPEYYTIKWGDTLTAIARQYNTTISKLVELNNIKDPNKIYSGNTIRIK